jgi:tetratricopeptide (TPR) repeat protein
MAYTVISSNNLNPQEWQSQNLNVDCFVNGDLIREVKTQVEKDDAIKNKIPAWCYNLKDPNHLEKLYNFYALNDSRGLLQDNYRLPTKSDLKILEGHLKNDYKNYNKLFENQLYRISNWWSITRFRNNENYSIHIEENFTDIGTSSHKEYCSVRGIKSNNKYLIDVETEINFDNKQKLLSNLVKADSILKEGNAKEAISIYLEIVPMCINNPEIYFKIGVAYVIIGDLFKAKDFFEKSILLDPNKSDTYYYLGISNVLRNTSGVSYAETYFDEAIKLNPLKSEYYQARAEERLKTQNYEGYIEDIEKAKLDVLPYNYHKYRAILKSKKGDYLGAIAEYDILINSNKDYSLWYYIRGKYKLHLDKYSALIDFEKALELNSNYKSDDNFLFDYGIVLFENGKIDQGLELFSESIRILNDVGATNDNYHYWRSKCLLNLGKYEDALKDIKLTLNNFINDPSHMLLNIEILINLSLYNDAFDELKKFKEKAEEWPHMKDFQDLYYFLLGEVNLMTKKYQLAYENYQKAGDLGNKKAFERIVKNKLIEVTDNTTSEIKSPKNKIEIPMNFTQSLHQQRYPRYFFQKEEYCQKYKLFLNEFEYQNVISKVHASKSLKNFIDSCKVQKILPKEDVFVKQISVSSAFMFVFDYNKIDIACIELFDIWVKEVNMKYNLCEDETLIFILKDIIRSSNNLAIGKK